MKALGCEYLEPNSLKSERELFVNLINYSAEKCKYALVGLFKDDVFTPLVELSFAEKCKIDKIGIKFKYHEAENDNLDNLQKVKKTANCDPE